MGSVRQNFGVTAASHGGGGIDEQLSSWFAFLTARPLPGDLTDFLDQLDSAATQQSLAEAEA